MLDILKPCTRALDQLTISILSECSPKSFSTDVEDASGAEIINSINTQKYNEHD